MRELTPLEARVLGVLVEKQATVPDTYPLSLNALLAGCNQKTARQPVMEASEAELIAAVDALKALSLVVEVSGARVARYEHNMARVLGLPSAAVALLAVLMLRGPQTAAELRQNSERIKRFADIGSVEAFLDELAGKTPPRVVRLARAPGTREARWAHLLCGMPGEPAAAGEAGEVSDGEGTQELARLRARVEEQHEALKRQADELQRLWALVRRLAIELGVQPDEASPERAEPEPNPSNPSPST